MSEESEINETVIDEIEFFIFNIIDINFGIETGQVIEMLEPDQAEKRNFKASWFHEKIPFPENVTYKSPKVLVFADSSPDSGIITDLPENIVNINIDHIHPLPQLIEGKNSATAIWGAAVNKGMIILLVDPEELLAN